MIIRRIVIGTRGSQLSLVQTELIKKQLQVILPKTEIEIQVIKTMGDKNMDPIPLDTIGKGWFTKELDKALLDGRVDLVVHSLKDIPESLPKGLIIAAVTQREDAREALVTNNNRLFAKLKKGAIIGTDSTRRKVQILQKRPDLVVKSVRGNVNRRLEKLDSGTYDGIFLAVAGLKRLGLANRITEYFSESDIIPSPGQGALAIVARKDNKKLLPVLKKLNHSETIAAVRAERAFSRKFGGGCKIPVGAYAACNGSELTLYGVVGSLDGREIVRDFLRGDSKAPVRLGNKLAKKVLAKSSSWFFKEKYVVITRSTEENKVLKKKIEQMGYKAFSLPAIMITKKRLDKEKKKYLQQINSFDWLVFTSRNGVRYFMDTVKTAKVPLSHITSKKIAVVGPKTAEEAKRYGLTINFIPSKFTSEDLARELQPVSNKKILMSRANIANPLVVEVLKKKGATVVDMPIYQTIVKTTHNKKFDSLLEKEQIQCILFTSPSTVVGFLASLQDSPYADQIFTLPVVSIGPLTTKKLETSGFKNITTADIHTIEGMLTKLQ